MASRSPTTSPSSTVSGSRSAPSCSRGSTSNQGTQSVTSHRDRQTSLSCRRRTRATRCVMPVVLYTDADALGDKLVKVVGLTSTVQSTVNLLTVQSIILSVHLCRALCQRSTCRGKSPGQSSRGKYFNFRKYPIFIAECRITEVRWLFDTVAASGSE